MNKTKLRKLESDLRHLRLHCHGLRPDALASIAKQLGRERKAGFTNEPTYVRLRDPALTPPLSIPAHATLKSGTARNIISILLDDIDDWKQYLLDSDDNTDDA